jgi:hypothetical protein
MFKKMRRKDRQLTDSETEDLLRTGVYGILSMVGLNGYGYGVPLSYAYTGGSIYCHCALEGQKLDNIRNNEKVSFCVVGEAVPLPEQFSMKYKSAIVFGRVHEVEGEEKLRALIALVEKYSGEHLENGKEYAARSFDKTRAIRIDIEEITGKARK